MCFDQPSVDAFRFGGMAMFFTWSYGPNRRLFENKVIHPLSFEYNPQPYFCPQLHRKRRKIKLRSLAWARHHKERLKFHPRIYARHIMKVNGWRDTANSNLWGGLWDTLPYDLWGLDKSTWYMQQHHLDSYDDCRGFDHFCSTFDPLALHNVDVQTESLVSEFCIPRVQRAFIAANSIQGKTNSTTTQLYTTSDDTLPIVIDSGASISVTPCKTDFSGQAQRLENQHVDGITETATIEGIGIVKWSLHDDFGNTREVETLAYYMPQAKIRLLSPQHYFQYSKSKFGSCNLRFDEFLLTLADNTVLRFNYDVYNNLPMGATTSNVKSTPAMSNLCDLLPTTTDDCNNVFQHTRRTTI